MLIETEKMNRITDSDIYEIVESRISKLPIEEKFNQMVQVLKITWQMEKIVI